MTNQKGRQFFVLDETMSIGKPFDSRPAMLEQGKRIVCQRCGSSHHKPSVQLPIGCYYCPTCIRYGRITSDGQLVIQQTDLPAFDHKIVWPGVLTSFQQKISQQLVANCRQKKSSLVWSVTGSGKTEMIFETIRHVRQEGGRVAIVSPRIDVCRELFPRIQQAFPQEESLLLYGKSEEPYRYTTILIATTHQLLHFYRSFQLIVVDEVDAFPYEGDAQLRYGLYNALAENGCLIYLSATPSERLLQEIRGKFAVLKMPLRFHQRPLIVPKPIHYSRWAQAYRKKRWLRPLLQHLQRLVKKNFVLVFCPSIQLMKEMEGAVRRQEASWLITSVSSQDEKRMEKVQSARSQVYKVLFTTMILERGVTFENVSVVVLGASHPVFTKSALVQIAGRVDRKGAFTEGEVIFFYDQMTEATRQAIKEINEMNQLARSWLTDEV